MDRFIIRQGTIEGKVDIVVVSSQGTQHIDTARSYFLYGDERHLPSYSGRKTAKGARLIMPREQKTKSKAAQKAKQRATATYDDQTIADAGQAQGAAPTRGEGDSLAGQAQGAAPTGTWGTNDTTTTDASDVTSNAQPEQTVVEQSRVSNEQVVWPGLQPSWPSWPTSKPGPRATPSIPGTHPINSFRPEQYKEIGYNQQTGEPATQSPLRSLPDERTSGPTSFDQPLMPGKGKQRL
jgi:hypothetical protein